MKRYLIVAVAAMLGMASAASNYVYILTGQSNSLGAVKGSPASSETLDRYSSHGLLWNGNMKRDSGECFELNPSWDGVSPQLPAYDGSLCMGPEYGFSYMMHHRGWHTEGGDKLYVVKASLDGGGNKFWMPGAPAYKSLSRTVKSALAKLGQAKVQGLLYLQGESDKGDEVSAAPARFQGLHARLKKEVGKGLKYAVAGECATWNGSEEEDAAGNTTAKLMYALAKKNKSIGWVRTRDLTKITSGDSMGVHYDGKSQITIGSRYAYAVAVQEKLPMGSVRSDAPEVSLDSSAAWWGGKMPKEDDVACWDVAAANVSDRLCRNMSVGGLLVEDPFRGEVSIAPDGEKSTVLRIGKQGIALQQGNLALACDLHLRSDQTWRLESGRKLLIGTPESPVALSGSAVITIQAPADALLELHLAAAPECEWNMPGEQPQVLATIGGKPAQLVKQGSLYKLECAAEKS